MVPNRAAIATPVITTGSDTGLSANTTCTANSAATITNSAATITSWIMGRYFIVVYLFLRSKRASQSR